MTRYISKKNKEKVAKRAKNCCEYCHSQMDYSPNNFSIEHIIPIVKNGTNELDNLALSCQSCNNKKYTKIEVLDEVSGETVNIYHPRIDNWTDHFKWNDNKTIMIGKHPKVEQLLPHYF